MSLSAHAHQNMLTMGISGMEENPGDKADLIFVIVLTGIKDSILWRDI